MAYIVDMNTSGRSWTSLGTLGRFADALSSSFYWGPTKKTWDLSGGKSDNGRKVILSIDTNGP